VIARVVERSAAAATRRAPGGLGNPLEEIAAILCDE
jgi:hypothetical protein